MRIGVTGATGFLGRYIVRELAGAGHSLRCWRRPTTDIAGMDDLDIEWLVGGLGDDRAATELVTGCDAVVHAALDRPGSGFRGSEGDLIPFVEKNVIGTLKLIEAARIAGLPRFVFVSSCSVHEKILNDRPLDETHPLWSTSHYGAHKAAIEEFVHSYGLGQRFPICAIRPTGIYGMDQPADRSKWFDLVQAVVRGEPVQCRRGGKEVHAADVAKAIGILLSADPSAITGEAFNCYDTYVSEWDVATLAKSFSKSASVVSGGPTIPKNQIATEKIRGLGMAFGGRALLEATVEQLVKAASTW
jgi:nucleoside-diphosphate-sugar epimerase